MADEEKLSKKEKAFLEYKTKGNDAVSAGQVIFSFLTQFSSPIYPDIVSTCSGLQQQDITPKQSGQHPRTTSRKMVMQLQF
jgi:hypothetical protein